MKITSKEDMDLSKILYSGECSNCLKRLYDFKYHPDADGGAWDVSCSNCGKRYYLTVSKVKLIK